MLLSVFFVLTSSLKWGGYFDILIFGKKLAGLFYPVFLFLVKISKAI